MAQSLDGTDVTKNFGCILGGFKPKDKCTRCPITKKLIFATDPKDSTVQSRNNCIISSLGTSPSLYAQSATCLQLGMVCAVVGQQKSPRLRATAAPSSPTICMSPTQQPAADGVQNRPFWTHPGNVITTPFSQKRK